MLVAFACIQQQEQQKSELWPRCVYVCVCGINRGATHVFYQKGSFQLHSKWTIVNIKTFSVVVFFLLFMQSARVRLVNI